MKFKNNKNPLLMFWNRSGNIISNYKGKCAHCAQVPITTTRGINQIRMADFDEIWHDVFALSSTRLYAKMIDIFLENLYIKFRRNRQGGFFL